MKLPRLDTFPHARFNFASTIKQKPKGIAEWSLLPHWIYDPRYDAEQAKQNKRPHSI